MIVLSLTSLLSGCDFMNGSGDNGAGEHEHKYINAVCSCGKIDPNHKHSYEEGRCVCGDLGNSGHQHEYEKGFCECGEFDQEYQTPNILYTAVEGGYEVSSYEGNDNRVIIPGVHEGLPVLSVGTQAFEGIPSVKSVYISDNIKEIKAYAFNSCPNLKYVLIGKGIKTLGEYAFADLYDLEKIDYRATACDPVVMGYHVFHRAGLYSDNLTLYVTKNVTIIPNDLFYGVNYQHYALLKHVVFEDNSECKEIGDHAFMHLRDLESWDWGKNPVVERIGDSCFGNCMALTEFFIPKSVRVIEKYAFGATTNLENFVVEDKEGWCARKFDLASSNYWAVLHYMDIPSETIEDKVLGLRGIFNGYFTTKIVDPVPSENGWHEHNFVDGVCNCWEVSSDHQHSYENGVCACKDVLDTHEHVYDQKGVCACKAINSDHVHEFTRDMCACGMPLYAYNNPELDW